MDSHRDDMVKHISNKSTRDLKDMFNHVDSDHSGFIDNDEVHERTNDTLRCTIFMAALPFGLLS